MKYLFNIVLILLVSFSISKIVLANTKNKEDLIEIKIIKSNDKNVEAQIVKIDDKQNLDGKNYSSIPQKIKIIGQKKTSVKEGKNITDIVWNKVSDDKKLQKLKVPLHSSIVAQPKLENGDQFKARGSKEMLIEAIRSLDSATASNTSGGVGKKGNAVSGDASSAVATNNTSKLSSLASIRPNANSITSSTTGEISTPIATTDGCSVRVDYQLNKVFLQQRMVNNGAEVDACRDTSTYFDLSRDYEICPSKIDTVSVKNIPYFQYFYVDDKEARNLVDQCQPDNSKATSLTTTRVACDDYVDLTNKIVYAQQKQYYKDTDNKDVLLTDCTIDRNTSYQIYEDKNSCGVRSDFAAGYSVQRSRLIYQKNNQEIEIQSCKDTTTKYLHNTTTDTCSASVGSSEVTTYVRKYIMVDGVLTYISDCEPASNNITIQTENCTTTPFTHDFEAGQSYRNKNYFYIDSKNSRVELSSCIKSQEVFTILQDVSVCTERNDDVAMLTTIYSKKYIVDGSNKIYITDCQPVTPTIPYTEVGYKWSLEYNTPEVTISARDVSDSVYIGSAQGQEVTDQTFFGGTYTTKLINQFSSSSYTPVCSAATSYSYSGNVIDLSYSDKSTIKYNNYVSTSSSSALCYNYCSLITTTPFYKCYYPITRECNIVSNTLYYQRCNNYRCPIYKYVKKSLMRRKDGTELVNSSRTLETKYTCGDSGLNNSTSYF